MQQSASSFWSPPICLEIATQTKRRAAAATAKWFKEPDI
jgi:hypothetical protein